MGKVIAIGKPRNDSERMAIAHLRDKLPDSYTIIHNFEIAHDQEFFEVDIAIIGPFSVCLVDVKGTHGTINVYSAKWYPPNGQSFSSPLLKLRSHAKTLKGIITESHPTNLALGKIWVGTAILLTSPDAVLMDIDGKDKPDVVNLSKSASFFQDISRIPGAFSKSISQFHAIVTTAIKGKAKPQKDELQFGNWKVKERLGGTDQCSEYRGFNAFAGPNSGSVFIRVYKADPYLNAAEKKAQKNRIANAYQALSRLPSHPAIIGAKDFFPTENEDAFILVAEDVVGKPLQLHMQKPELLLTFDQKKKIVQDVLSGLFHTHSNEIVHRNLSPECILACPGGQARLTNFDYSRTGKDRSGTIAGEIVNELNPKYQAPECFHDPVAASCASDVFSAGLIFYELFTGQRPFQKMTEIFDCSAVFPEKLSALLPQLPQGFDEWLQRLCSFEAKNRPDSETALQEFNRLFSQNLIPKVSPGNRPDQKPESGHQPPTTVDFENLPPGFQITETYVVQNRLGKPGGFGVAYKVFDAFGEVSRVIKLVLKDRHSKQDRLKKEYQNLLQLPDHVNVIKVIHAGILPGSGIPYLVFPFVDGSDVGELIEKQAISQSESWEMGKHIAAGLDHIHRQRVCHCDVKPRNILWTSQGARLIDFNVSIAIGKDDGVGGGSKKYLPPDFEFDDEPSLETLIDRDIYALAVTLYEALTGRYPWNDAGTPPPGKEPNDIRTVPGCEELSPKIAEILVKALFPRKSGRFPSAAKFVEAMLEVKNIRTLPRKEENGGSSTFELNGLTPTRPNQNLFLSYLLTLYSQSSKTNSGTRGLDSIGEKIYVETALDRELIPAVLAGEFSLVIISGNAGDGKTSFLQRLEKALKKEGGEITPHAEGNGMQAKLGNRFFFSNHDGSQDEGKTLNDDVLKAFFQPFTGKDDKGWPKKETRLIAINEGRLIDFLECHKKEFPFLARRIKAAGKAGLAENGLAYVNLNLRSVVSKNGKSKGSIVERFLQRIVIKKLWQPCQACDLKDKCYVFHNVLTFQDKKAGSLVFQRLRTLFELTHLRGLTHITLRDLRSALAFMLAGTRDCDEIHQLYSAENRMAIAQSFYFNAIFGGESGSADRLVSLFTQIDIGEASNPGLDGTLDFLSPGQTQSTLLHFEDRPEFDDSVLEKIHADLPREYTDSFGISTFNQHKKFLSMRRRKMFFERRDSTWESMLPFISAGKMLDSLFHEDRLEALKSEIIAAINRGEGFSEPDKLSGELVLQVRQVERGLMRSFRLFPEDRFTLQVRNEGKDGRFIEHSPSGFLLVYQGEGGLSAILELHLDLFEMLEKLNQGFLPGVEDIQGRHLKLIVFKNLLNAAPYQEILVTKNGHDFFKIQRKSEGELVLSPLGA